jgi:hypothetical protein
MADAELVKLNQLIQVLDEAIDKHVRELANLAEHNGYAEQADELHHLIEIRNARKAADYPEPIHHSLATIDQALECSKRELDVVSGYLSKRMSQRLGWDAETTIPPIAPEIEPECRTEMVEK